MRELIARLKHAKQNRRHMFIGITLKRYGHSTKDPMLSIRFGKWFFHMIKFGRMCSVYGGFEQTNDTYQFETPNTVGYITVWKPFLPKIVNVKHVAKVNGWKE